MRDGLVEASVMTGVQAAEITYPEMGRRRPGNRFLGLIGLW